jgi:hypothetical protein
LLIEATSGSVRMGLSVEERATLATASVWQAKQTPLFYFAFL